MYQDHSYRTNWEPENAANARRFNSSTRSGVILGTLFGLGLLSIVIIVLSLIPIYISHQNHQQPNKSTNPKLTVSNYQIRIRSERIDFLPINLLNQEENRENFEAALTSIVQDEISIFPSIVQIDSTKKFQEKIKIRQEIGWFSVSINFSLITAKICPNVACLNNYQIRSNFILTNFNRTTSIVRYQETNKSSIDWLELKLSSTIQSNVNWNSVDFRSVNSTLQKLINIDELRNRRPTTTIKSTTN